MFRIESTTSLYLLSVADEQKPVVVFEELVVAIATQTDQAGRQVFKDGASGTTSLDEEVVSSPR